MSIDLNLDRIRSLSLHLPTYTRPTCHIAGTNGKGSVSSMLCSILSASSPPLSVGRFNSPHLASIYDCIVINNQDVDPDVYASARADVEKADKEHSTRLSSFELLTLTALLIFERAKLDVVVIEVGLGGRLDATNVIPDECVLVSALTAVDLDHQAFLGDTVIAIAKEKAAIARKGRPFVIGEQKHPEVEEVVEAIVHEVGGHLEKASRVFRREWDESIDGIQPPGFSLSSSGFQAPPAQPVKINIPCFSGPVFASLPLYGEHQLDNLGLASSIISALLIHPSLLHRDIRPHITPSTMAAGIKNASWPGRLSFHTITRHVRQPEEGPTVEHLDRPLVILADGAHNPASSATLARYIDHLLSLLTEVDVSVARPRSPLRTISLTYIIALSHSPPKTPLQTLSPLFHPGLSRNPSVKVDVNVAVLRFTPPEGMPWVKSVAPSDLQDVVRSLAPDAVVWAAVDDGREQLPCALEWAAGRNKHGGLETDALIILAGSLYLVADFYRLLRSKASE